MTPNYLEKNFTGYTSLRTIISVEFEMSEKSTFISITFLSPFSSTLRQIFATQHGNNFLLV